MRATIDKAGRLVIPAELRERVGLAPGPVEVTVDGAGLRIELPADGELVEDDDLLIIRATGTGLSADQIRALRMADQA